MSQLNDKARKILDYITKQIGDGVPPSVREICAALQIKSTSTVHKYLKELEEEGYIGQPILAVEEIEEYIPFQTKYGDGSDLFALHVRGESMINAGILDGDIIVARREATADNGEIIVALVEDEATVKRFYKENGHYRLQPENDTMDPIIVDSCAILGKVIACLRLYE